MRDPGHPIRVLLVGQVPPPLHGQAIMIRQLLQGRYARIEIDHIPMTFSSRIEEVGRVKLGKVVALPLLVLRVLTARIRRRYDVLYYPPAGPSVVPVIRDIAVLLSTRWAFPRLLLHFHAAGLTEIEGELPPVVRRLFRVAFGRPAGAIRMSSATSPDPQRLGAEKEYVLPYGVDDLSEPPPASVRIERPAILFVGSVQASKGVRVLLEAARELAAGGHEFELRIMGGFTSRAFEHEVRATASSAMLEGRVRFLGVQTGQIKEDTFRSASIFCFPSSYESESFPVVVLEAMRSGLPIVASRWRGIPGIIDDRVNGLLVEPANAGATAEALATLLTNRELARTLGRNARAKFLENYTSAAYTSGFEDVVVDLCADR